MSDNGEPARADPVGDQGQRIAALDFVRGIAVMGILVANLPAMAHPLAAGYWPGAYGSAQQGSDTFWWAAQYVLLDGKMRGLFTLLFGAGVYLFVERAEAKGSGPDLQARRLLILLLAGAAHYLLLWRGDILVAYALGGLVMLAFLRLSRRAQAALGFLAYGAGAIFYGGVAAYLLAGPRGQLDGAAGYSLGTAFAQAQQGAVDEMAIDTAVRRTGGWWDMVAHTAQQHPWDGLVTAIYGSLETLPLMLLGMASYRYGLFRGPPSRRALVLAIVALVAGGAANAGIAAAMVADGVSYWEASAAFGGLAALPNLAMVLGYAVLLTRLAAAADGALGTRVAAAGRCAFTNYIGSSAAGLILFSTWGFDRFGQWTRTELYAATAVLCLVMLIWSKAWLTRYRFGPLEWLWRCATYGRRLPIRR